MKGQVQGQSTFISMWMAFLGILFLALYIFSIEGNWNIPQRANWAVWFMLYYLYFICARTMLLLGLSLYEFLNSKHLPEISSPPLVTIIVPCFNEAAVIQESIRSVARIDYPNLEILVVDDGSTDDTFEKAMELERKEKIRVLTKPNGGKADALNFGISQALGDYILCVDADSVIIPNVLKLAMPYFQVDANLAAVAGSVVIGNSDSLITKFQSLEYIIGLNFHKKAQSALNLVTIVPGPIGVFKKSVLKQVGGYETDTFAEDADLTLKILTEGFHIKYCSEMIAITEAPRDFHELCIQRYRWSRGTIQAIMKNLGKAKAGKIYGLRNLLILIYTTIETMLIPAINFIFAMLTLVFALYFDNVALYGPFFFGLIMMDMTIALYSIIFDKKVFGLFFLSIVSRVTYGFSLEIMRFYAMIDELMNIPMKWGTLTRKGVND